MKLLTSLKRIFPNKKVKKQLNFIYFTALLIPILIIGIFLIFNTRKLLLDHYHDQVASDNTRVRSIMFDVTTTVYNISDEIFTDKTLQDLLSTRYATKEEATKACSDYTKLNNYLSKNTFIESIDLYTINPTIYEYASFKPITSAISSSEWFEQASVHADINWKSLTFVDAWDHTSQNLCLIRRIPIIATKEYAVLVIKISNNYLKNRIVNNELFNTVAVNNEPVFFSTERDLSGTIPDFSIDYTKSQYIYDGIIEYKGQRGVTKISTLLPYASKDKIYLTTIDFAALPDASRIIWICSAIIVLATTLPLIFITKFNNQFSSRIITLRSEMHKSSTGDYHIIDDFQGDDELSEVFLDMKVMIESIQQMDAKMYEARIQEQVLKNQQQKMEFKMLASQINPHFLYNTLETIRMKAFTEGNREVANAIKLLGKFMHHVLENTGTSSTTLKKELDYINTYLSIQKLRFNERVNYTLTVPDDMDLEEYQILPLLLQPVVENAILHGLEGTESTGQIFIDVKTIDDEFLSIHIFDNGLGMSEEELLALNNSIQVRSKKSAESIGLYNVNQRIKLFYGESYGMDITSRPQEGTLVTLTLPLYNTMEE